MRVDDLFITEDISVLDAMRKLDETGLGVLFVAPEGVLRAVVTDGDIRRYILKSLPLEGPVREAANYSPYALPMEARARAKTALLEHGIGALPLLDKRGRVQDVVFAGGLDIDTHKKACAPVVIMAGGLGTRLYPYTKILPKPLIPIGEMPIVEHIIHRFADVGCSAFTMIVNYKKSMIKSYFNDLQKDYTVDYVDEDTPLGTGGGLSLLKGKVTQTFFLTNCDILIDADFGDIYQYHKEKGNVITMVCAARPGQYIAFTSMGVLRYLSAMKYCAVVAGNSSSGVVETPSLGVPCVNVGDRQKGRLLSANIICCAADEASVYAALQKALSPAFAAQARQAKSPYNGGDTSGRIVRRLEAFVQSPSLGKPKLFYDGPVPGWEKEGSR